MVTVQLYGTSYSTCTKRVWAAAREIGVEVKVIPVNLGNSAHKESSYIDNYHPFGIIPVLEDEDGTKIYESRAIARYLIAKYAPESPLLPNASNPKAYGLFEQAASVEYSAFDPPASSLAYEKLFGPMRGWPVDDELVKQYIDTLNAKLEGYERILSKQKYLAGDTFTLADLFHLPYGAMMDRIDPSILSSESKPHVKAWWADISSRESWKAAQNIRGKS